MAKVNIALNFALMMEMIRAKGVSNDEVLILLKEKGPEYFAQFGEGIPDWNTLLEFAHNNWDKVEQAIQDGYQITFLTFGALRSLLRIKFNLLEQVDYEIVDKHIEDLKLSSMVLDSLKSVISQNWTITELQAEEGDKTIKIELTHKGEIF